MDNWPWTTSVHEQNNFFLDCPYFMDIVHMGRNIYYPNIFGHILNRKNQTFIKFGKILKEYFLKPRIGFLVFKNRSN
jgi:hypothetical protein